MTATKTKQARKPRKSKPITIIVEHEFVGIQTVSEALTPIIIDDLQRKINEIRTIDSINDTA
jgi:hypothetical protein